MRKSFLSQDAVKAFFVEHGILTLQELRAFRQRSDLPRDVKALLVQIPGLPHEYYKVKFADLTAPVERKGLMVSPPRRDRVAGCQFLTYHAAIEYLEERDLSFHTARAYQAWLTQQPIAVRQILPLIPQQYYTVSEPEIEFIAVDFFTRVYSWDIAVGIMRQEGIRTHGVYKRSVKGTEMSRRSAYFQTYQRFRLPRDYRYYVQDDDDYRAFFGQANNAGLGQIR